MSFKVYSMPRYDGDSNKWYFEVFDKEEVLLERVEHDTQQSAIADQKQRIVDDVLNGRVMREVRR